MISLDGATVLLQWSTGGLFFLWITSRHRLAGLGYGWLLRGTYLIMAVGALVVGLVVGVDPVREAASAGVALAVAAALAVSIARKGAGVSGQRAEHDRRTARVAAMTGIERDAAPGDDTDRPEFNPALDLLAPAIGAIGLIAAGWAAADGGQQVLAVVRTIIGAAFLGSITDAMLLGHWYLVQPGLPRRLLSEMVRCVAWVWPFEIVALLWPVGMVSVINGSIDDGWGGMLGWMWVGCAVTTIVLVFVTEAALKERQYSAVMAATGLLYLAILMAFGTDLVARATLA